VYGINFQFAMVDSQFAIDITLLFLPVVWLYSLSGVVFPTAYPPSLSGEIYMKAALAELIGTFTLVFIGAGAGALADGSGGGLVGVALAHGLALMVIVYTWGAFSGAHVNPAVTLGVALTGRISSLTAVIYWTVQFIGALAAAFLLAYLLGRGGTLGQTIGDFTPVEAGEGSVAKTIVVEAILTFFLVTSVFASGVLGKNGNLSGVAIGLVLTMDILMGAKLTGASMNPARTFGPAFVMGNLNYFWVYLIGPFIGAGVGALLYDRVFTTEDDDDEF
jgi:MIP family channel proteins